MPGGFLFGQSVLVIDGPLSGCVGTVRDFPGMVRIGRQVHNVVEVLISRRAIPISEAYLRLADQTQGATL